MDDMNTNNVNMSGTTTHKSKKGLWITLIVLGIILLLTGVGVASYYMGNANKAQEVETAKLEAARQQTTTETDTNNNSESKTPAKTETETTCNADELTLTTAENGESGAGTLSYDIVLTNTGKRTCILGGYPGVSLVNDNGNQIGSPAERTTNIPVVKVTLLPNAKVKAHIYYTNEGNYPAGECKDGATKLRVYPPNDTGYLSVATATTAWCPNFKTGPVMEM